MIRQSAGILMAVLLASSFAGCASSAPLGERENDTRPTILVRRDHSIMLEGNAYTLDTIEPELRRIAEARPGEDLVVRVDRGVSTLFVTGELRRAISASGFPGMVLLPARDTKSSP